MKMQETKQGVVVEVYVKPRSKEFKIVIDKDEIVVFCKEGPFRGKVNRELVKEFSKLLRRKVTLISGFTSRQKKLLAEGAKKSEVARILSRNNGHASQRKA